MLLKADQKPSARYLTELASSHPCRQHPLFAHLRTRTLSKEQAVSLLVNYDAHATLLRRLLLKAAAFMPEPAVGFILENVRNEYGNGDYRLCHQGQLRSIIDHLGGGAGFVSAQAITKGVRQYLIRIGELYCRKNPMPKLCGGRAAIAAGAITATELMAIEEFKAMQVAFAHFGLAEHAWFDHVNVECEHGEESLALAAYFMQNNQGCEAVEFGFQQTLNTNVLLYDGLLEAIMPST